MRQLHYIRSLIFAFPLLGAMPAAAQSIALDSLPQASQEEISRVCLPVQFREGAGAYRNCVQAELDLRSSTTENDMAKLSFDDKYAVQQACARAGGQSTSEYQACVSKQIQALNKLPAPIFDDVSEDEQYVIQQTCFDAQSSQGAASYRQCLNAEVQSVLAVASVDTSGLSMLNKNALQLRCSATADTAAAYRQCVAVEFESIAGTEPTMLPPTTLAQTSNVQASSESSSQTLAASTAAATATSAATSASATTSVEERQARALAAASALSQESEIVRAKPSTETIALSDSAPIVEQNLASENLASTNTSTTSSEVASTTVMALPRSIDPRRAQLESILETTTLSESTVNSLQDTSTNSVAIETAALSEPEPEPRVISRPDLVQELETKRLSEAQGIEFEPQAPSIGAASDAPASTTDQNTLNTEASSPQAVDGLWQKFLDTLASLDGIGWLIVAGVLALPALLLGLFSIFRKMKQPNESTFDSPSLADSLNPQTTQGPGIQTRMARHEQEAAELFGDTPARPEAQTSDSEPVMPQASNAEQMNTPASNHLDEYAEHDAVTRMATKSERAAVGSSDLAWQSAFGHWLTQQPESAKLESCIEFLIYWIAYGDERFEPELKERLFVSSELSSQDQIKRWVLKQDVFAFSDVVTWMRNNASQTQLDQSIDLALAMLVTENSLTPAQNTIFRFLSDAFNMGKDELERRFQVAFGHALPDVPRPDKEAWWDKQNANSIGHWDSRAMATQPELEQMKARLGLSSEIDDTQVISAFRRAARRCHPDRFTDLGERERALAAQSFTKFEEARDKLLGVSV